MSEVDMFRLPEISSGKAGKGFNEIQPLKFGREIVRDLEIQTAFSCFVSGHIKALSFSQGRKIFSECHLHYSELISPAHILTCLDFKKDEVLLNPLLFLDFLDFFWIYADLLAFLEMGYKNQQSGILETTTTTKWPMGSLVVRASDSRPEGSINQWVRKSCGLNHECRGLENISLPFSTMPKLWSWR
ncbi:hypothetical protein TNCV_3374291 [Trichonephila clavipes]|nr:hypothetical protein TNCV_3374291 [Trichonephila clavipes]